MTNITRAVGFGLTALLVLPGVAANNSTYGPDNAVRAWYEVAAHGSWVEGALPYGTLGGIAHYRRAYDLLAPSFRTQTSEGAFLGRFKETAFMRLDQAEPVSITSTRATVFVEDERDMVLEDLPATVHYFGTIALVRVSGDWEISAFNLHPEYGVIAARDAGHGDASNISDVSQVAIAQFLGVKPFHVDYRSIHYPAPLSQGPVVATYETPTHHLEIRLAKLFSGEFVALHVSKITH